MSKYNNVLMETAETFAKLSYCKRKQVGAVISKDGRPLVTGYNGTAPGANNCCERECEICKGNGCEMCDGQGSITTELVSHAEVNAIYFAAKNGIKTDGCEIYITSSPCLECSKAIVSSGIKKVYYKEEYRDTSGIDYLSDCGIFVKRL